MFIVALAIMAGTPPVSLSAAQKRQLTQMLVCPEQLPDDAARIANTDRFMQLYLRFAPKSRSGERINLRDRILKNKKCRDDHPLQHTYPET